MSSWVQHCGWWVSSLIVSATGLLFLRIGAAPDFSAGAGGILGQLVGRSLYRGFGAVGGNLFLLSLLLVSVTLATGLSWLAVMDRIGKWVLMLPGLFRRGSQQASEWQQARAFREEREEVRKADVELRAKRAPVRIEPPAPAQVEKSDRAGANSRSRCSMSATAAAFRRWRCSTTPSRSSGLQRENPGDAIAADRIQAQGFPHRRASGRCLSRPVITRFELEPAPGIKVSQISSLDKDIARGLSVKAVRVVDVIPGKSVVGLETPNTHREMIYLSELLRSKEYDKSGSALTLALGKDIAGRPTVADLARMPHLLVAGTTGSGKSVAVNAMVLSLLYKASAKDVRMLMIDPKMLELSVYQGIPHLLAPVVTDMKEAANALRCASPKWSGGIS